MRAPHAVQRQASRNQFRPSLELLEARWMPVVKNWVGPLGAAVQDFNVAANWAPAGVPGAFDDARIPATVQNVEATFSVTINSLDYSSNLTVSGGTFKTNNVFEGGISSNKIGSIFVENGATFETENATSTLTEITNQLVIESGGTFHTSWGTTILDTVGLFAGMLITDAGALTEFNNGSYYLASTTSLSGSGDYRMLGAGSQMVVNVNVSVENFQNYYGLLAGGHDLTITNSGLFKGGTLTGAGKTIIDSNADLELDTFSAGATINRHTLVNKGTINWGGANPITFLNNGVIDNQSGAVFNTAGGGTQNVAGSTGTFRNAGTLYIGGAGTIGILTIAGNFTQTSTGNLIVDINGTTLGTTYSQLNVVGIARLAGTLTLNFGYGPSAGDTYTVVQGGGLHTQFATIDDSSLLTGWGFNILSSTYSFGAAGTLFIQGA
jgi:hypothetical protein